MQLQPDFNHDHSWNHSVLRKRNECSKKKSLVLDRRKQKIKTEFIWQVVSLLGSAEGKKNPSLIIAPKLHLHVVVCILKVSHYIKYTSPFFLMAMCLFISELPRSEKTPFFTSFTWSNFQKVCAKFHTFGKSHLWCYKGHWQFPQLVSTPRGGLWLCPLIYLYISKHVENPAKHQF